MTLLRSTSWAIRRRNRPALRSHWVVWRLLLQAGQRSAAKLNFNCAPAQDSANNNKTAIKRAGAAFSFSAKMLMTNAATAQKKTKTRMLRRVRAILRLGSAFARQLRRPASQQHAGRTTPREATPRRIPVSHPSHPPWVPLATSGRLPFRSETAAT